MNQAWERRPKESYPAFEAFNLFLTLRERSYPKVADALKKSVSLIKRWAKENRWRERADAYDAEIQRKAMDDAAAEFAAMVKRHTNIGRMLQVRSANALQAMNFENLPPKFITPLVTALKAGIEIERAARQMKLDKPQENIFVETLEKISQRIADDDD